MASEVSICNIAIVRVGHDQILSLDQDNKAARLCKLLYPELRDTMLRAHTWNFAIKRIELALSTETPGDDEFEFAHVVPDDCLKILTVLDNYTHRVETNAAGQKVIVSNEETQYLRYVSKVTDPNLMDPLFRQALSLTIAAAIAVPLTENAKLAEVISGQAEEATKLARSMDAQEGTPLDLQGDDLWLRARGENAWDGSPYQ